MDGCCIVTLDETRGRFFIFDPRLLKAGSEPLREEGVELVTTEPEEPGSELWGDTRGNRVTGGPGKPVHGLDDHREAHVKEFVRRLVKRVLDHALRLAERQSVPTLIVVAEKQLLGFVREATHGRPKGTVSIQELGKNLSHLTAHELYGHLAAEGMLPPRPPLDRNGP